MKISDAIKAVSTMVNAKLNVLLTGAPGIGKTDLVSEVARVTDHDMWISHPVVSDPTDYKGLPVKTDDGAEFIPFGDLKKLIEADKPTIAFFDDLGQASVSVQAAVMQLLLARRINGHRISDHVTFIAATNRRQDKAGVSGILEPVKSRFASIIEVETDYNDWSDWALHNDMPASLIAFIRMRPNLLCDFKPTVDMSNSPVPRTVANFGKLVNLNLPNAVRFDTLKGATGEGFATEYLAFEKLMYEMPDPDSIFLNPDTAKIPGNPSATYALCIALAKMSTPDNFDRAVTYANRLSDEFSVLMVKDAVKVNEKLSKTKAFVEWTLKHKDVLF